MRVARVEPMRWPSWSHLGWVTFSERRARSSASVLSSWAEDVETSDLRGFLEDGGDSALSFSLVLSRSFLTLVALDDVICSFCIGVDTVTLMEGGGLDGDDGDTVDSCLGSRKYKQCDAI